MAKPAVTTQNPAWGFWGTAHRNGYDAQMSWDACAIFLSDSFTLTEGEVRAMLDARFGRHLADELSFIPGGPSTAGIIVAHLKARAVDRNWHRWFAAAVRECRSASSH